MFCQQRVRIFSEATSAIIVLNDLLLPSAQAEDISGAILHHARELGSFLVCSLDLPEAYSQAILIAFTRSLYRCLVLLGLLMRRPFSAELEKVVQQLLAA